MSGHLVLDVGGSPLDRIELTGLTARGFHGVFDVERREGQDFRVDVVLHVDTREAAATDDLAATVHYGELASALAGVVRGDPVDLIETLATRLADVCLADERVEAADVVVHKPHAPIPEQFGDVAVAIRRTRADVLLARPSPVPLRAVVALGANLGEPATTLRAAVAALRALDGVQVVAVSPAVQTPAVGGPPQPDYLNAVVLLDTTCSPLDLLAACGRIERDFGRERIVSWGPRTLDLDLVAYGDLVARSARLELPHPRAHRRAFVLAPWHAADPDAVLPLPGGGAERIRDLLGQAPDRDAVHPRPDLNLNLDVDENLDRDRREPT